MEISGGDHFQGCLGQEFEAAQGLAAFALVQVGEHSGDELGFEHLLLLFDARAGGGEEEIDAAAVHRAASAEDVAGALQAVDGERHGGRGDAHVAGEIEERGGLDVVEMVEDAGLVAAKDLLSFWVADVPLVAGGGGFWGGGGGGGFFGGGGGGGGKPSPGGSPG